MSTPHDVVVIGAGPGGYVAAIHGAQAGLDVVVVERQPRLGGTCLLRGCIPTKALLESATLYERITRASRFGIQVDGVALNFPAVQKTKDKVVTSNAKGVEFLLRKAGVTVVHGHGRLGGPDRVLVTDEQGAETTLLTRHVLLATGSRCGSIPQFPVDHEVVLDSDDILELDAVPDRLVVIGAGAVGVEFASIYRRFGSQVHLIELMEHLLPLEDVEISGALAKAFKRQKIGVRTGSAVQAIERLGDEAHVHVKLPNGDEERIVADKVLVAIGRAPVTDALGLDAIGVTTDARGFVEVDEHCRTTVPSVFAIGDIIRTPQLAHVASHEGILVMDQIAGREAHPLAYGQVPNCTYCHPEVASVGLSEQAAIEQGYDVKIGTFPYSASGKATIAQERDGLVKIVADTRYDEILGVHIVGHHATELIAEGVLALRLECTTEELMHTIHPHPTLSEIVGEAAHAAALGTPIHA